MKYKYKKAFLFIQFFALAVIYVSMIVIAYRITNNERILGKIIFGALGLYLVMVTTYSKEFLMRYVELLDNSIRFNSFRLKDVKMKKAVSFNIRYQDVLSVDVRTIPLIGIWGIQINAKNLPHKMTLSFCFHNHIELYKKLCGYIEQYNPNAYIDSRLKDYIERCKHG